MVVDVKPQVTIDYSESKVKQLLARYRKAKAVKDQWTPIFEDCYEYALPQRESFYSESIAKRRSESIFDETAVVGVQESFQRSCCSVLLGWRGLLCQDIGIGLFEQVYQISVQY